MVRTATCSISTTHSLIVDRLVDCQTGWAEVAVIQLSSFSIQPSDPVSGVHSGGVPPVPIPNTAVKTAYADNTGGTSLWKDR